MTFNFLFTLSYSASAFSFLTKEIKKENRLLIILWCMDCTYFYLFHFSSFPFSFFLPSFFLPSLISPMNIRTCEQ